MSWFRRKERTPEEKRELAKGAQAILADPAFEEACSQMERRLLDALVKATSTEEKLELVAKLKCLMQIAAELAVLTNELRMAADRARRAGPG